MSRSLGTLTLDFVLQLGGFKQGFDRAARETQRGAQRIQSNLAGLQRSFATAGRALAGLGIGFSVASVVHGLADATAEAIKFGDEIGKAMAKTGLGAEAMSELAAVAKQSEVELETLTTALRNMQVVISDAAVGNKEAARALKDLGLSAKELQALAPDQQFELIAQRISEFADAADRAGLRQDIFKRAAEGLAPIMEDGARGIREAREEIRRLGGTLSEEQVAAFQKADQAIDDLTTAYDGLKRALGGVVAEPIAEFFIAVADAMGRANDESLTLGDRAGFIVEAYKRAFADKGILAGPLDLAAAYAQITEEANKAAKATQQFGSLAETIGLPKPTGTRTRTAPADEGAAKRAASEAEQARKTISALITSLEQQANVTGETEEATIRFRIAFGDLVDDFEKAGPAFEKRKQELIDAARAADQFKASEELKKTTEQVQAQAVALRAARIEQEKGAVAALDYSANFGELAKTLKLATGQAAEFVNQATLPPITLEADTTQAMTAIENVIFVADRLTGEPVFMEVQADTSQAQIAMAELTLATATLTEEQRKAIEQWIALRKATAEVEFEQAVTDITSLIKSTEDATSAIIEATIAEEQGALAALNYAITQGRLKDEFEKLGPAADDLRKKLEDVTRQQEILTQRQAEDAASESIIPSRTKALKEYDDAIAGLQRRLAEGDISQRDFAAGVKIAEKNFKDATRAIDDMSVFAEQAARNMQDAFADFLFDPFEDGLEGMVSGFADTLRRMAANIVAAQLAEKFHFEDIFKGGGIFGDVLGSHGGISGRGGAGAGGLSEIAITAQKIPLPGAAAAVTGAAGESEAAAAFIAAGTQVGLVLTEAGASAAAALTGAGTAAATALTASGSTVAASIIAAGTTAAAAIGAAATAGSAAGGLSSIALSGFDFSGIGFAGGGKITGPGTGTSDSIPAWLSAGEFVVKAEAVRQPGIQELLERINARGGVFNSYATGGNVYSPHTWNRHEQHFATGGIVTATPTANPPQTIIQQSITINAPSGHVSRATEMQVMAAGARGAKTADRRNN